MGNHVSSQLLKQHRRRRLPPLQPTTVRVIHQDGRVEEYDGSVRPANVLAENPGCYLCNGEDMRVGECPPWVAEGEELNLGHLYFVLPLSASRHPLSLSDICWLAGKAYVALQGHRLSGGKEWRLCPRVISRARESGGRHVCLPEKENKRKRD